MPAAFITAIGTDIGKTYVTAGLARCLIQRGRKVAVLKPVVSGFAANGWQASDPSVLLAAIGVTPSLAAVEAIAPWRWAPPVSPDMAARRSGTTLDFAALSAFCRDAIAKAEDMLLIEGIGGLMVPLTAQATVLDLIAALQLAPILVAGTYVGSLSHTLTALEVLQRRGLGVAAIVLNESPGSAAAPEETAASLKNFVKATPLISLRHDATRTDAAKADVANADETKLNASSFSHLADLVAAL
jgi:dethiobiotin synthetase